MEHRQLPSVICFGDSNTFGAHGFQGGRYPREVRWCGALSLDQDFAGKYELINMGENGRGIPEDDWEMDYVCRQMSRHMPVRLLIIMLGTNDLLMTIRSGMDGIVSMMDRFLSHLLSYTFYLPGAGTAQGGPGAGSGTAQGGPKAEIGTAQKVAGPGSGLGSLALNPTPFPNGLQETIPGGSAGSQEAIPGGPAGSQKAISEGPAGSQKAISEGLAGSQKAIPGGPAGSQKAISEGPAYSQAMPLVQGPDHILLIAPPPTRLSGYGPEGMRFDRLSLEFASAYRALARKRGCHFADAGSWQIQTGPDGVHFTREGHASFARGLKTELDKIFSQPM